MISAFNSEKVINLPISLTSIATPPIGRRAITEDEINEKETYLQLFETAIRQQLLLELERLQAIQSQWSHDGLSFGLPGIELQEMLHHYQWAKEKVKSFIGREDLLIAALHFLSNNANNTSKKKAKKMKKKNNDVSSISFSLIGQSGCGKTALMAKIASQLFENEQSTQAKSARPILIRFCGTSSASTDAFSLVKSLITQIQVLFPVTETSTIGHLLTCYDPADDSDDENITNELSYDVIYENGGEERRVPLSKLHLLEKEVEVGDAIFFIKSDEYHKAKVTSIDEQSRNTGKKKYTVMLLEEEGEEGDEDGGNNDREKVLTVKESKICKRVVKGSTDTNICSIHACLF